MRQDYILRGFGGTADEILNLEGYSINLISLDELKEYLNEIRLDRKKYLTIVRPSKEETDLKSRKELEIFDTKTNEVLIFDSLKLGVEYIQGCGYSKQQGLYSVLSVQYRQPLFKIMLEMEYFIKTDLNLDIQVPMKGKQSNQLCYFVGSTL